MRFHVLGIPHTVTNHQYTGCAYTQKVLKFCKMMTQKGHHVFHYGHEDSDVIASEHVNVISNKDLEIAYGNYNWRKNFFKFDMGDHAYQTFFKNHFLISIDKFSIKYLNWKIGVKNLLRRENFLWGVKKVHLLLDFYLDVNS